jgi:hypothetical protein
LQCADHFDENHHRDGIHEVHADEAIGTARGSGQGRHGNRGSVGREDHFGAQQFVCFAQDGEFQIEAFGDGFDGEIGARQLG